MQKEISVHQDKKFEVLPRMSCCTDIKEEHEIGWGCRKCVCGGEQQTIQDFQKK
jgi:hypothetical protein